MTMNTVNSEVQSMLGAIDSQLGGDQLLKMAITLLILDVLLGKEGGTEAGGAMLMAPPCSWRRWAPDRTLRRVY